MSDEKITKEFRVDKEYDLEPAISVQEGNVQDVQDGQFHRSFSPRQVHVSM